MKVHLEILEIAWLQNIKREPAEYDLHGIDGKIRQVLFDSGLVVIGRRSGYEGLCITELGESVLRAHLPYACFANFRQPIGFFKPKKYKTF